MLVTPYASIGHLLQVSWRLHLEGGGVMGHTHLFILQLCRSLLVASVLASSEAQ